MFISPIIFLSYFIIFISFYFGAIIILSRKNTPYLGLILPAISLAISVYNFIKPYIIYNPHPTMKEGVYMTFFGALAIAGFIVFGIVRYITGRKKRNESDDI